MKKWMLFAGCLAGFSACMDQYNPRPYWAQFDHERNITSRKTPLLTEKGELPPAEVASSGPTEPGGDKFASLCASCHGNDGKGDSPAAASMNPKPRNFHDTAWQGKVTDDHIAAVIKNGGAANGLSATMPPWGAVLSDDDVKNIVALIRKFGGK